MTNACRDFITASHLCVMCSLCSAHHTFLIRGLCCQEGKGQPGREQEA
jgi:hypothetical protein